MRDTVLDAAADTAAVAAPTAAADVVSDDIRTANRLTWVVLAIFGGKFAILLIYALAARYTG